MQMIRSLLLFAALSLAAYATTAMFSGLELLVPGVSIIGITLLVGWLARMVRKVAESGLAVLVQFLAASFAVLFICVPDSLIAGFIPGPSSISALVSSVSAGFEDVATKQIPLEATGGLITIFTLGFGFLALIIDGLVSDLRISKVPAFLLLTVWAFPVYFASVHTQPVHMAAISAAFIIVLLTEYASAVLTAHTGVGSTAGHEKHTAASRPGAEALRQRGTVVGRAKNGLRRFPGTALLAGALALLLGMGLPTVLPAITATPHYSSERAEDLTIINPFLTIRNDLQNPSTDPVFTYTTTDPGAGEPIRLTSVSEFDGEVWKPAEFPLSRSRTADGGLSNARSQAPAGVQQSTEFSIGALDQAYLPAPFAPTQTHDAGPQWLYDSETLTIVGSGVTSRGLNYSVDYLSLQPTAKELDDAGENAGRSADQKYTQLPDDVPAVITDTARELTEDADSQWAKAAAIQAYFRGGDFTYSLEAPTTASSSALADFMKQKKGYCVQFSAAMASMTRSLGIPTRIGVGFTAGSEIGDGEYQVTLAEAHAWPELFFDGIGWVRFEPTPGGPVGDIPAWTTAGGQSEEPDDEPTEDPTSASPEPTPEETEDAGSEEEDESDDTAEGSAEAVAPIPAWVWLLLAAAIIIALLFLPMIVRAVQRRRRLRAGAAGLWDEITATAADAGLGLRSSMTAPAAAAALAEYAPDSAAELASAARASDAQRYGNADVQLSADDSRGLVADVHDELFGRLSGPQRVLKTLLPASVFDRRR